MLSKIFKKNPITLEKSHLSELIYWSIRHQITGKWKWNWKFEPQYFLFVGNHCKFYVEKTVIESPVNWCKWASDTRWNELNQERLNRKFSEPVYRTMCLNVFPKMGKSKDCLLLTVTLFASSLLNILKFIINPLIWVETKHCFLLSICSYPSTQSLRWHWMDPETYFGNSSQQISNKNHRPNLIRWGLLGMVVLLTIIFIIMEVNQVYIK